MNRDSDVLLVGQIPPPLHGQAVVTKMLFDHEWEGVKVELLPVRFSSEADEVGVFKLKKVWHLIALICHTVTLVWTCSPRVLYYLPASPHFVPVFRDVVYLLAVKWMFQKTIFHFHAGGLDKFLDDMPYCSSLVRSAYGQPSVAIDVNVTSPPSGLYFGAKENIVIPNGIDVPILSRSQDSEEFRVLTVGLLCEEKGILELIKTAAVLRDQGAKHKFFVVGEWVSDDFKEQATSLMSYYGVSESIAIIGKLEGDEKWQVYADSDVFFFPSHHPTETFGMVLVEAMAYSLPIVTTRWRSLPYVVAEGKTALLCEPKRPQDFARALQNLMMDSAGMRAMGMAGRERYLERFTKDHFLEQMKGVYRRL